MIKGVTLNLNAGTVKIKSISQVLNEMNRRPAIVYEEDFVRMQMRPNTDTSTTIVSTYDERGNESVSYLEKIPSIQKSSSFKELKKNFAEYLLTTKEVVLTGSSFDDYNMTTEYPKIKVKLENLLQGIEAAAVRISMERFGISNSFALFPLKPRTWCLFAEDAWFMVPIIKAVEGSLLGISLVPFKAKSWVIIEVERASDVS
jgi:hypothetical protein